MITPISLWIVSWQYTKHLTDSSPCLPIRFLLRDIGSTLAWLMASHMGFACTGRPKRWCLDTIKASSVWVSLQRSSTLVGSQVIGTQWASEKVSDLHNSSFPSTFAGAISAYWNLNFDLPHAAVSITASTHSSSASGWTLFLYSVNSKTAIRHSIFLLLITVLSKTVTIFFFYFPGFIKKKVLQ